MKLTHDQITIRVFNLSRQIARRLTTTTVGELKETFSGTTDRINTLTVAQILALSATCEEIDKLTRELAGWPKKGDSERQTETTGVGDQKSGTSPCPTASLES